MHHIAFRTKFILPRFDDEDEFVLLLDDSNSNPNMIDIIHTVLDFICSIIALDICSGFVLDSFWIRSGYCVLDAVLCVFVLNSVLENSKNEFETHRCVDTSSSRCS